jgi:hypothetical protein
MIILSREQNGSCGALFTICCRDIESNELAHALIAFFRLRKTCFESGFLVNKDVCGMLIYIRQTMRPYVSGSGLCHTFFKWF